MARFLSSSRVARGGKLLACLIVLSSSVLAGAAVSGRHWDAALLAELASLNLAVVVGTYSLWGFSTQTMASISLSFGTMAIGACLGSLAWLLAMSLLARPIPWAACGVDMAILVFTLPLILHGLHGLFAKLLPPVRCLVLGRKTGLQPLLEQVCRASLRKLAVVEYMNPSLARLAQVLQEPGRFDSILIADSSMATGVATVLEDAKNRGVTVEYLPDLVERSLRKIPMEVMKAFPERYDAAFAQKRNEPGFRILDLMLALVLLVILLPVTLLAAVLILVVDGRPILFTQERHGFRGKKFKLVKLRTMDAVEGAAAPAYTRSGRFLRATHLNEIPQFLNVLAGHMSIVGPRPDIPDTYESCMRAIPEYALRTTVRPGMTGIAQIYYRYIDRIDIDAFSERLAYDAYWVKNRSLGLYVQVALLTARSFVFRRGS